MYKRNSMVSEELDWRIRVFDSLSFPTLILKPDRDILSANEILLKKFGTDLETLVGKKCHEFFYDSKEICPSDSCPLTKVLADKTGHSMLRRIITDDGRDLWEDRVFSPILDEKGEIRYIIESLRDITRLKTLERELKETEAFLEKVIQSSASAIVVADCNGKILLMNQAAEELFEYSLRDTDQTAAMNVQDLYPPGTAKEIMRNLRDENIGGKGKLPGRKITILNAAGEEIPVEITAAIIYENGEELATMGIYNDLREKLAVEKKLKEAQTQVAQAEKMASLGQLAAGVAHEINNPLTGILFHASLALETLNEVDPIREDLENAIEDVHRCEDIVRNLLAYSRQTNPTKDIIQLNTLVDQSLALVRIQMLYNDIEIVKEMSEEMMLVHVDKNQLTQVVINLVMNAVAAMDRKGTLTLRTYRNKPGQKVYLEVSDTGCGIPKENLSRIFDPFFTTKEPGKGTGLGLSTAYGIIRENGGNISVTKTSSDGTSFLVELPLYRPSEEEQVALFQ
jgi:PAS domain S-box-containing protein